MFRKSGDHFFDQNMLHFIVGREFFSFGRSRPNGKRATPLIVGKRFGRSIVCVGTDPDR